MHIPGILLAKSQADSASTAAFAVNNLHPNETITL